MKKFAPSIIAFLVLASFFMFYKKEEVKVITKPILQKKVVKNLFVRS